MTYSISEKQLTTLAEGLTESERQQLTLLLETPEGTVVLDREFGVDYSCLDNPPTVAQNLLAASLAPKIPQYIPSLRLVEVQLSNIDMEGKLAMKVVVDHDKPI